MRIEITIGEHSVAMNLPDPEGSSETALTGALLAWRQAEALRGMRIPSEAEIERHFLEKRWPVMAAAWNGRPAEGWPDGYFLLNIGRRTVMKNLDELTRRYVRDRSESLLEGVRRALEGAK